MWLIFIAVVIVLCAAGLNFLIRYINKKKKAEQRKDSEGGVM